MGHTQYGAAAVQAATANQKGPFSTNPIAKNSTPATPKDPDSPEWDFYSSKKLDEKSQPSASAAPIKSLGQPAPSVPAPVPTPSKSAPASATPPARYQPPRIPRGAYILQLAALKSESDALALTDALQQKKFPAFVATPGSDNLYRVQVGPYGDQQSASVAKRALEHEGFKAIVKH